jgi:hypothetical protein
VAIGQKLALIVRDFKLKLLKEFLRRTIVLKKAEERRGADGSIATFVL